MKFMFVLVSLLISLPALATEEPAGCWAKAAAFPCAIRSATGEWVERPEFKVYLGAGSAILVTAPREWQILTGQVWTEAVDGWSLRQLGRTFAFEGQAWIEKSPERLVIHHFDGETRVQGPLGSVVPEGYENWWTLSSEGVIRPVAAAALLNRWNHWMHLPKAEAKKRVKEYAELWRERVEQSADLYRDIVQRRIAAVEDREEARFRRQRQMREEQLKMRRLFRDRYESQ